ncbi:MAG TPA: arylsulfotransferase family protein [Solirubrobacteraceae bacterium]|nr:arylsulfotransferase family protein [Solirubrobacteraceae bacterium]
MKFDLRSHPTRHRRLLAVGSLIVVLGSATTLAIAAHRIASEQAAFAVPASGRCVPSALNRSAVLPGTSLAVTPLPDSFDALPRTQISLLGEPAKAIGHVEVRGSVSGTHSGRLRAYSQGDGASFVPSAPFVSGETVTVTGTLSLGAKPQRFAFHFVVAREDVLPHPASLHPSKDPSEKMHFHSLPTLEPPNVVVSHTSAASQPGYIFAAPYSGPGQAGPMIFDEAGNLIWFSPVGAEEAAANLQVQELGGKPVLTWWQGYIPPQGFGMGEEVIAGASYKPIGRIHAGNGYKVDLHDFHLTPQGTAVLTAFQPIRCDLSSLGGPQGGAVTDSLFQEVDLRTGLVRREWHSVDHVPLSDSYSSAVTTSMKTPFDFFHLNSIDQLSGGATLISARNTWGVYELNSETGQVLVRIGGKRSNVKLAGGTHTAYQHDASVLPDGNISIFDNGGVPMVHPQSRGLIESIDGGAASLVASYERPEALKAGSQGNMQLLANGDFFLGWGAEPYFSEFSSSGQLLYDAHFHGSYESYRGYRFAWTGAPTSRPTAVVSGSPSHQTVYVSWNGDTRTATWRLLDGTSAKTLAPVASVARTGFETALKPPAPAPYLAVQALDASGAVLGTSATVHG